MDDTLKLYIIRHKDESEEDAPDVMIFIRGEVVASYTSDSSPIHLVYIQPVDGFSAEEALKQLEEHERSNLSKKILES